MYKQDTRFKTGLLSIHSIKIHRSARANVYKKGGVGETGGTAGETSRLNLTNIVHLCLLLSVSVCLCLCVGLYLCSVRLACLSVCLSFLSLSLSLCGSISLFCVPVCLPDSLTACLSIYLSVPCSLSIRLSVCLSHSVCLSVCLSHSVCLSVSPLSPYLITPPPLSLSLHFLPSSLYVPLLPFYIFLSLLPFPLLLPLCPTVEGGTTYELNIFMHMSSMQICVMSPLRPCSLAKPLTLDIKCQLFN